MLAVLIFAIGIIRPELATHMDAIHQAADAGGLHYQVVATVVMVESRGDNRAANPSGAVCLMGVNSHVPSRPSARALMADPALCLDVGVSILRRALDSMGNLEDGLRAYNVGVRRARECATCGWGMVVMYRRCWQEMWGKVGTEE